jgi:hypothetical protein
LMVVEEPLYIRTFLELFMKIQGIVAERASHRKEALL